jgi:hypothetical protein
MRRTLARRLAACMCAVVMLPMSKGFSLSPPSFVVGICHVSPGCAPRHYVDTGMKAKGGKGQGTTNAKGFGAPPFNPKAAPQTKAAAPAPPSTPKAPLQARAAAAPLLQHQLSRQPKYSCLSLTHTHTHTSIYMYVCMYVCMYACMHACIRMHVRLYLRIVCMYVKTYACMYVHTQIHAHTHVCVC